MSSFLKIFAPAIGGAASVLTMAYVLADQFVVEMPAPLRVDNVVAQAHADTPAAPPAIATETSVAAMFVEAAAPSRDGGFGLGRAALEAEIAAWDIDVRPDGQGLPVGSGDVWTGEEVYIENCAMCHGDFGEAVGRWPVLAGGQGTIDGEDPVKTIGSYWPYLSTVYDYINRAMPFGNAQSLTPDEVYAITAYLLYMNDVVDDDFELSNENFTEVRLPNEDNFFFDDRAETEYTVFTGEPCMTDCKETVEITMRARVLDVTPDNAGVEEADAAPVMVSAEPKVVEEAAAEPVAEPEVVEVAAGPDPALVAAGENLFRRCASCHQVGEGATNRSGPQLNGVFGRPVGGVDGFRYSGVFQEANAAGDIWAEDNMRAFLADPRGSMKGTRMSFAGLRSEEDLDAMIAYLSTFEAQ